MNKTIIVIDDEELIRQTFSDYLSVCNYTIITANDGEDAIKKIEAHEGSGKSIDLVLSDIYMPKMNGIDMFAELKSQGFNKPFVFITGYFSDFNRDSLKKQGVSEILFKPIEFKQLLLVVENCLMA